MMRVKLYYITIIINFMIILSIVMSNFFITLGETIDCGWPQYMHDAQRTGFSPCEAPNDSTILWMKEYRGGLETSPIVTRDKVFMAPSYHGFPSIEVSTLYGYSIYSGILIYALDINESRRFETPAILENDLYYIKWLNNETYLVSYDLLTRKENWISEKEVYSPTITILFEKIYLASKQLLILDQNSGKIALNLNNINEKDYEGDESGFTIGRDKAFINIITPESISNLVCFDINSGKELWRFGPSISTIGNIIYDNEKLFFTGNKLFSTRAENGEIIWEYGTDDSFINPSLAYDRIYVVTWEKGKIFSIDKNTGKKIWESGELGYGEKFIVVADKKVFAVSYFGKMIVLDADNGNILWDYDFDSEVHSPPAVANGILFVGAGTKLYAFSTDPDVYLKQGDEFFQKKEYQKALDSYQKAKDLYVKINNLEGIKKIEEMEKRIKMIEGIEFLKENRTGILLIGSIIIVVILYAVYRKFKTKNQ